MKTAFNYSVQLLTTEAELTQAFELRYKTYKISYPKALENLTDGYETNIYDIRSVHIGLFCDNGSEKIMVGCSRLVIPFHFEANFSNIYNKEHPLYYMHKYNQYGISRMPLIDLLSDNEAKSMVNGFCDKLETKHRVYCEASRLIIEEQHRSIQLAAFFVSSIVAICNSLRIDYCFFQCDPHHISFYRKFGINLFPGLESFETLVFGKRVVIFGAVIKALQLFRASILPFTDQFAAEHQIRYSNAA